MLCSLSKRRRYSLICIPVVSRVRGAAVTPPLLLFLALLLLSLVLILSFLLNIVFIFIIISPHNTVVKQPLNSHALSTDKNDMPLGLEDHRVHDGMFRSSSHYNYYCEPRNGRLNQRRTGRYLF